MIDPKSTLAGDRFRERGDRLLPQVFDRPAGGADQVVMVPGLAPHISGHVPRPLEALGQAGADQPVE